MTFNGAQIHLLINHFPVLGFPIVLLAFAWGLVRREDSVLRFSLYLYFIVWLSTGLSYFTGDSAEHVLKLFPNFERNLIHQHEDVALWSFILSSALLLIAIPQISCLMDRVPWLKAAATQRRFKMAFIFGLLVLVGLLAIAAHLGGLIRHPEIR